jgi:hypothetical protein
MARIEIDIVEASVSFGPLPHTRRLSTATSGGAWIALRCGRKIATLTFKIGIAAVVCEEGNYVVTQSNL